MRRRVSSWLAAWGIAVACALSSVATNAQPVIVERLSDVCAGPCNGFRSNEVGSYAVGATRVYFVGSDSSDFNLDRPWVSDGTPAGTFPLARIATDGYGVGLSAMVTVGDVLYFTARTAASGDWADSRRLWRSDGTPGGTMPVDFPIPSPKQFGISGNGIVHPLSRGVVFPTNLGIWWVPVEGGVPRTLGVGRLIGAPVEINGVVYFLETPCMFQCPPETISTLRRYDGASVATVGALPVPLDGLGYQQGSNLVATADGLFMVTLQLLWTSDGTSAPRLLRQWSPPAIVELLGPNISRTRLLFSVYAGSGGTNQLWTSDGTVAGTRATTSFALPASFNSLGTAGAVPLLSVQSASALIAYPDAPGTYPRYSELAVLDPAFPSGTRALRTLASGSNDTPLSGSAAFDGGVMFRAGDLWYTNGTAGGTQRIDPALLGGTTVGTLFGSIGRTMFFAGFEPSTGTELYRLTLAPGYPSPNPTVEVTEYYHAGFDHYFMTGNPDEKAALDSGTTSGWARTGFGFTAYAAGSGVSMVSPVCRFYGRPEAGLDSHFYSASTQECADVVAKFSHAWIYESADVFEVTVPDATGRCSSSQAPIYRAFNRRPDVNHRYSVHALDQKAMQAKGWQPEGMTSAGLVMCGLAIQRP